MENIDLSNISIINRDTENKKDINIIILYGKISIYRAKLLERRAPSFSIYKIFYIDYTYRRR